MQGIGGHAVERLRRLLASPSILVMPTAHDPVSAWLSEMAGFEAVLLSRAAVSLALTATDDADLIDDETMVQHSGEICRLVSIPVLVDLTPVRGSVGKLRHTAASLAMCGVAGLIVDDSATEHFDASDQAVLQRRVDAVREGLALRGLDVVIVVRTVAGTNSEMDSHSALARLDALGPPPDLGIVDGPSGMGRPPSTDRLGTPLMHLDFGPVGDDSRAREAERDGFRAFAWAQPLVTTAIDAMRTALNSVNTRDPESSARPIDHSG
jgi:hypothetical protein